MPQMHPLLMLKKRSKSEGNTTQNVEKVITDVVEEMIKEGLRRI